MTVLCIAAFSVAAFADIARPDRTPTPEPEPKAVATELNIQVDPDIKKALLLIPRSLLNDLKADTEAAGTASAMSKTQNIISGLFLSLALVFGGIWMARGRRMSSMGGKAMIALFAFSIIAAATTIITANVAPIRRNRIDSSLFKNDIFRYRRMYGDIDVQLVDDSELRLIIPQGTAEKTKHEEE